MFRYAISAIHRLSSTLLAAAALSACAAGDTSDDPSGGTADGPASGVGGMGAGGDASGGSGGAGGGLCGQDCSLLETPPCLVAVCNDGQYPGEVGACTVVDAETGTPCDDGMFCTVDDFCEAGSCKGGPANDCGQTPAACNEVVCDENAQSCTQEPASDGASCTPADLCEVNATCQNGQCIGIPKDCTFAPVGECNTAVCNPANGMCEGMIDSSKNGTPCSLSGNLCNVGKTCNEGQCVGGSPKDCSALTMGCNNGVCDMATGNCVADPVPAGGSCDDGIGVCEIGTCDMNGMCVASIDNGGACEDGDACTVMDTCDATATCVPGALVTTCSNVADGCCPTTCTAANDIDCACSTTIYPSSNPVSNNGWEGYMFDIGAVSKNVTILTLSVHLDATVTTVQMYSKAGTYSGFEGNAAAWTSLGTANVSPPAGGGITTIPLTLNVTIPAGQVAGFYFAVPGANLQSNGVNYITGATLEGDAEIDVYGGSGVDNTFGSVISANRNFVGTVEYEVCGS